MQGTAIDRRLRELLPELFEPPQQAGDRYLRFEIAAGVAALLPLESVREALQVPRQQVTLLPNSPDCVLGLVGAFNQVFCAIDLAELLGVGLLASNARQYAIVAIRAIAADASRQSGVAEGEPVLGLAVHRIQGVTNLLSTAIEAPPDNLPGNLAPCVWGASGGAYVLSVDALIAARALTTLT